MRDPLMSDKYVPLLLDIYWNIWKSVVSTPSPLLQCSFTFEDVSLYISVKFSLSLPGKFSWYLRHIMVGRITIHRDTQVLSSEPVKMLG